MIDFDTFWLFLITSVALALAPGPDILFVITQGITRGAKVAISLACGLSSGVIVHTTLAALGVSVVFKTSQIAFFALKIIGAAYLFYLAYQAFIHKDELVRIDAKKTETPLKYKPLFIRGFFMNVLNPKVILFFLALFPQFVKEQNGFVAFQMAQLGFIFMLSALVVFIIVGICADKASTSLMQNPKFAKFANILTSCIFVAIGIKLIFSQR
ncbi:MAG: LysE family translocator [Campylobacteraceae bacterium]|jgi:threonine/homoserine/homoserine lactone efflux protein|nr:LysE family translocator [Campylobacteraceae bacterium]